jgi:DNA recombination-dependent growth factor C
VRIPKNLAVFSLTGFCFESPDALLKKATQFSANGSKGTVHWSSLTGQDDSKDNPIDLFRKTANTFILEAKDTRRKVNAAAAKALVKQRALEASKSRRVSGNERMFIEASVTRELAENSAPDTFSTLVYILPKANILLVASTKENVYAPIIKHFRNTFAGVEIGPAWSNAGRDSELLMSLMTEWVQQGLPFGLELGTRIICCKGNEKSIFENLDITEMDPGFLKGRQVTNLELVYNRLITFRLSSHQELTHLRASHELKQLFLEHLGPTSDSAETESAAFVGEHFSQLIGVIDDRVSHALLLASQQQKTEAPEWVNPGLSPPSM